MNPNSELVAIELGIWTVILRKSTSFVPSRLADIHSLAKHLWEFTRDMLTPSEPLEYSPKAEDNKDGVNASNSRLQNLTLVYSVRFVKEVYSLGPWYFLAGILMSIWETACGTSELYLSTRMLGSISRCLETRQFEPFSIMLPIVGRVLLSFLSGYLIRIGNSHKTVLGERVKFHFLQKAMHKALSLDVSTAEDPEVRDKLEESGLPLTRSSFAAWKAFSVVKETITGLLVILSELFLMVSLSRTNSTIMISLAFCFVHPLLSITRGSLHSRSFVAFCNNSHFARMASVHNLAFNERCREDRIINNLGLHIEKEFERNNILLGDVSTDNVYSQWWSEVHPLYSYVLMDVSWDLSFILFALRVLWDHKSVTLEELFLLQEVSKSLQGSSYKILYNIQQISRHAGTIRNLYSIEDMQSRVKDGEIAYPHPSKKDLGGARIEFRRVSFKYPGTNKDALTELSFTINSGQLVVIVGVNGSGKSSAIKLLARLYDPSSGEILLDGLPLSSYKLAGIRNAMAILRQDHPVLPVSLRENVALGLPERSTTDDEIAEAIRLGGADQFVKKLKQGSETVLNPVTTTMTNFVGETDTKLKAVIDDKETKTDLSGGETQRLSASRTFLRLLGGNIRLLVADEPTSALDPAGEHELFSRLREHRHGKTVIFITHRFGHLTKHADLVLCLKDGRSVEQGTHEELLAMGGEYKRLYDIQAKAFVN